MGQRRPPLPSMPLMGLLLSDLDVLPEIETEIRSRLGVTVKETDGVEWHYSRFYESEMGKPLWKKYLFFRGLIDPSALGGLKVWSNDLENQYVRREGDRTMRRVNIDPGYLDRSKVVLASTKNPGHRVYLGDGIHAEISLLYRNGSYRPFPYTYPDIRSPESVTLFNDARAIYLSLLQEVGK